MSPYYQDEFATIYHGDCRDVMSYIGAVDLVLTDPPYAVSVAGSGRWETRYGRTNDLDFFDGDCDWKEMTKTVCDAMLLATSKLTEFGSVYAWVGHRQFGPLIQQFESDGWKTRFLVWSKSCPVPPAPGSGYPSAAELCLYAYRNGRTWTAKSLKDVPKSNVLIADSFRYGQLGKVDHPTQKPIAVIEPLIRLSSKLGGTVLDCFSGSGTTLVAAKQLGRKSVGIELEERYCEIAANRLAHTVKDLFAETPTPRPAVKETTLL
jgi:site-specific DNA-methyltransferase (adenine-specific)